MLVDNEKLVTSPVPSNYTDTTSTSVHWLVNSGQLNKVRVRPQIINEHVESSRNLVSTVTSGSISGQVFRNSQDNINGIEFTANAKQSFAVDDFESYNNDTELQAAWVATNTGKKATLETVNIHGGLQAMKILGDSDVGDEWEYSLSPSGVDFTKSTGTIWIKQNKLYADMKCSFFISDGVNTKSHSMVIQAVSVWTKIEVNELAMIEDGGTTDVTAITGVGFRLDQKKNGGFIYIDDAGVSLNPGSLELKLWNMGATMPVSASTSIDDGTQYVKLGDAGITGSQEASVIVSLLGGFRQYHVDTFVAGTALEVSAINELLIPGNYYMITFHWLDEDIEMFGPNPLWDNYYESGYSFTTPDISTPITATGHNEDLQFIIYSTQQVYINSFYQIIDAIPGENSNVLINVEDHNMRITHIAVAGAQAQQTIIKEYPKPPLMVKGGKFELNYNDDADDDVSKINLIFEYFFVPPTVYG